MDYRYEFEKKTGKIRAESHFTDEYVEFIEEKLEAYKKGFAEAIAWSMEEGSDLSTNQLNEILARTEEK